MIPAKTRACRKCGHPRSILAHLAGCGLQNWRAVEAAIDPEGAGLEASLNSGVTVADRAAVNGWDRLVTAELLEACGLIGYRRETPGRYLYGKGAR